MYTHDSITNDIYNIYYITYIYMHQNYNFLIGDISIEIVNCTNKHLENIFL